jgi:nucleotide-binding universal stress UspA family protein
MLSKILIAYDASDCSDAALKDLRRAGLPALVQATIVNVAYSFLPNGELLENECVSPAAAHMVQPAQAQARQAIETALAVAEQGAHRVKAEFPDWSVSAQATAGSPGWAILNMADSLGVDLIVVGTHGHSSAGGRLILGSVSQRVLYEASCSVRVARCFDVRRSGPVRIILGSFDSQDAEAAVDAVAARTWPKGSEARVVTAHPAWKPERQRMLSERLGAAGLSVTDVFTNGEPAKVLINEAERWPADSIFVGTSDLHGFQHFLHGSVSAAVAARAHCSVEVVRIRS